MVESQFKQFSALPPSLLKAIIHMGYKQPTPIQRKSIPLILEGRDVVSMARTGSGKTAAFLIPLIHRLGEHSSKVGARSIILSPSRELALQTLSALKSFGKGTNLRYALIVGGDSLDSQFSAISSNNPDVIVATPGRLLHIIIEMSLSLKTIQYVVFDEADRLFEMGFAGQLDELLSLLPPERQTLLFSATLPASLIEFAKAGLSDPSLVRLDAESKISSDLEQAFFTVSTSEKEAALLYILKNIIKLPNEPSKESATIVFTSTKWHVEFLTHLLKSLSYSVSYIYSSLDHMARKIEIGNFRAGKTNILVVTDIAARGIDIPLVNNVINFDFPAEPKIFIHRVGRTARAGRRGWAYSLVTSTDMAYLLDLGLVLSKKVVFSRELPDRGIDYTEHLVSGCIPRIDLEKWCEIVQSTLDDEDDMQAMKEVANRGAKNYLKGRANASVESLRRARTIATSSDWTTPNPILASAESSQDLDKISQSKLLNALASFRPAETIFEMGSRGKKQSETAKVMRDARKNLNKRRVSITANLKRKRADVTDGALDTDDDDVDSLKDGETSPRNTTLDPASEEMLASVFKNNPKNFKDEKFFMSHYNNERAVQDHGMDVHTGAFALEANSAMINIGGDEQVSNLGIPSKVMGRGQRWDKSKKKFVNRENDNDGSKDRVPSKMIKGESGVKLPASYRSGKFEEWKKSNYKKGPVVGQDEHDNQRSSSGKNRVYKHQSLKKPKAADKYRDNYEQQKKKVNAAAKSHQSSELRTPVQIARERKRKDSRKQKNARPSSKKTRK